MHQLIKGDKVTFDIVNVPGDSLGDVCVTNNGIDVKDIFKVMLDVNELSQIELQGYARGEDGRLIKIVDLDEDDYPELVSVKEATRKFVVSGKLELVLEKEIVD